MRRLEDRSIDLVLCDLPYGCTDNSWDSRIDLASLWESWRRVLKPGAAVVLTACQPFTSALVMSNARWFRHEWIWRKDYATGHLNAKRMPMRKHESILVFCPRLPRYFPQGLRPCARRLRSNRQSANYGTHEKPTVQRVTGYPASVLDFGRDPEKLHPTQKPVALFEYLIRTYTRSGALVLDCCMGSGTTAVACVRSGRRFVGFEKERRYFEIARKRIEGLR
jgi:site-specific DNA-methyltransferase (adenine-specific)